MTEHVHTWCLGRTRKERTYGHGPDHPAGLPPRERFQCLWCDGYASTDLKPKKKATT